MSTGNDKNEKPAKSPGKTLRNIVWITCIVSLVLVNVIAEVGQRITGIEIHMFLRLSLVIGLTFGAMVLGGAAVLVNQLGDERSLSGNVRDTLGADRDKSEP